MLPPPCELFTTKLPLGNATRVRAPGTTVIFKVTNRGKIGHDFKINGKKTRLLQPGQTQTIKVVFRRKGRLTYLCTVPGHATLGMKGSFKVT